MAITVKHSKVSLIPDAGDASLVEPSDWNADHVITGVAASGNNSDITSLTGITGGISSPDYVQFDTTITPVEDVAKMQWDDGNGTLQFGLKGGSVNLQIGQEIVARVFNDSGSTLTDGQIVYISGSQGNRIAVKLAKADSEATSAGTLGMVTESIASGAEGFITMVGTVNKLDTSGLTAGSLLYLSATTAGAYTETAPLAPNHRVTLGYVERVSSTVGSIYVKVDNGYELDELHNVKITTPTGGQVLAYDQTAGYWKNINFTDGTGISVSEASNGAITITNTAPDQVVSLTGSGSTTVTGTYPNFTISSTGGGGGVTSVTGTAPIASSGGSTPDISISQATTSTDGYLSSTDWNTFNNKQPAGTYVTSVSGTTGRITSSGGTTPDIDLASGIVTAGTTGSSSLIPVVTVDTYGRVTAITTASNPQGTVTSVSGTGTVNGITLTGSVTSSGSLTLGGTLGSIANSQLTNSAITINGTAVSLGGSTTVTATLAESTSAFTTGSAQTYTAPANTQWVKVTVVGPGGNGGSSNVGRATGGGGGAVAIKWLAMSAGQTLTYTVGTASGTASTVSSGTLSITTISAGSGSNGTNTAYAASLTAGPAGGTATGGDVNITGGKGGNSYGSSTTITTNFSGAGGNSGLGFGQGGPALAFVATAGQAGTGYGAGGGGAIGSNTAANGTGGIIIFEAY